MISIHAPAKGATGQNRAYNQYCEISIHAPAKGATSTGYDIDLTTGISIHAPAKGATTMSYKLMQNIRISIHAPAKGATGVCDHRPCAVCDFNPRSREGSDPERMVYRQPPEISIHAPAKGATSQFHAGPVLSTYFNPRSREGSDSHFPPPTSLRFQFQSTLPRRERQQLLCSDCLLTQISIHAPAKGATIYYWER